MLPTCLITALPAEARPLITYFGLRAVDHPHLRLYHGDCGYLLQCGVGKLNASAATATMLQTLPAVAAVINVGIAGGDKPLGTKLMAHSVQDDACKQKWFPHLPPTRRLAELGSTTVVTVDQPAGNYDKETAFDMEASGVFNAATKVLDLAFVHSIKVISDNSQSSIDNINANSVIENISSVVPEVETLMQCLPFDTLPKSEGVNALSSVLIDRLHYTTTEKHALNQLLHRYNALIGDLPSEQSLALLDSAKSVRLQLSAYIDNARISY